MRVLFSSTPEYSHLAPQVPLALELRRRGHEVLVACAPKLGDWVRRIGLDSVAAGHDLDPDDFAGGIGPLFASNGVDLPADLSPESVNRWAFGAVFARILGRGFVGDLLNIVEGFRPDLMVRDRGELGAWVVGEAADVPVVTVTFGAMPNPADEADAAGEELQALRALAGLKPDPAVSTLYAGPVLIPAPRSYTDPADTVLPSAAFVQPMAYDGAVGDPPAWFDALGSRPVVYVTMGSIVNKPATFRPLIDAFANEPVDVIMTIGRAVDPAVFGAPPGNVRIEQYVPQSQLLPHVDLVVCHAGFNTVIGALSAGRPLVVAPISADQPYHAQRCSALGVGRVVDGNALDASQIRDSARAVLEDPTYRAAAADVQRDIAALPDIVAVADLAEQTVARPPLGSS